MTAGAPALEPNAAGGDESGPTGSQALARVMPELAALAPSELRRVNLDIPKTAVRVVGLAPRIRATLAHVTDPLARRAVDLETYALAAWHAHAVADRTRDRSAHKALVSEGLTLRARLLDCAGLLARCGYFEERRVAAIRHGSGTLDAAGDLVALVALFDAAWSKVANKSPVRQEELRRGGQLACEILQSSGEGMRLARERQRVADDQRTRAFTLLVDTYDMARRFVTFVRWNEGDAEKIAPSLWRNSGRPKRASGGGQAADAG